MTHIYKVDRKGQHKINRQEMQSNKLYFEEQILSNPYHLKLWWNYLTATASEATLSSEHARKRNMIYERALRYLPRSYKLWHSYLTERRKRLTGKNISSKSYQILINTYERALVHMHKMPRIWLDYCEYLSSIHRGTETRKAFDRALQALPITQHRELWDLYIEWVTKFGVEETAIRVYRRYLMYDPGSRESFVAYLEEVGHYEEAARQLSICLNDEHYISPSGQTPHQMWMKLCNICSMHPESFVNSSAINFDSIIRSGIAKFSDEVGRLWNSLSDYFIRLGQFERARDVFEEAINSVTTVRDFSIVFDAYVKVEESILTSKIHWLQEQKASGNNQDDQTDGEDNDLTSESTAEINMRLARIEFLMDKRPLLLNSVVLRQNPHNVHEWHKRAKLFKENSVNKGDEEKEKNLSKMILTYVEAVKTVDPKICTGKLSGLWLALASVYEKQGDLENARFTMSKATEVNYKTVDELANVWCAWGEMEMRHEEYEQALQIMQQAATEPAMSVRRRKARAVAQGKGHVDEVAAAEAEGGATVADRLHKNVKVWSLYLDLEESLGTVDSCRTAYDRAIDLKVATAQMCLNFASFLEEHNFFEDSFRVYEKAVALFGFPQVKPIWLLYLDKFMARYGGSKLERLRDLFEQAVADVPADDAPEFYIKYAKAEEQYGLARHAVAIYDRATKVVVPNKRLDMFRLYAKKVEHFFGVTKSRPVYEKAVRELDDNSSKLLCLEFAELERKLGEVDRARVILQYGSQFSDPRRDAAYWKVWREFEEQHGNEDTFKDMLRVQRSVETSFSQVNYLASEMIAGEQLSQQQEAAPPTDLDAMSRYAELEALDRAQKQLGDTAPSTGVALVAQKRKAVSEESSLPPSKLVKGSSDSARGDLKNSEELDI